MMKSVSWCCSFVLFDYVLWKEAPSTVLGLQSRISKIGPLYQRSLMQLIFKIKHGWCSLQLVNDKEHDFIRVHWSSLWILSPIYSLVLIFGSFRYGYRGEHHLLENPFGKHGGWTVLNCVACDFKYTWHTHFRIYLRHVDSTFYLQTNKNSCFHISNLDT